MIKKDTIVAIATPFGYGSVSIIRISGPLVTYIAQKLLNKLPTPRYAEYLCFKDSDGSNLDKGIALYFPSPNSFTGEDVLELQGHGSPITLDLLLNHILSLNGIRVARPGEFSERAFMNQKLDLIQAEAIAALINAKSAQAAKAAMNSLQGNFSKLIYEMVEKITDLRIYIESSIDFSDESIDYLSNNTIKNKLDKIIYQFNIVLYEAQRSITLNKIRKIVLIGKPNSGKSSLFNKLIGHEVAIVTNCKGTTRDVLKEQINLDGILLNIVDTAGLHDTNNIIEKIGIEHAWREVKQADHILLVLDSSLNENNNLTTLMAEVIDKLPSDISITIIRNKIDLIKGKIKKLNINNYPIIDISTYSGEGIDILKLYLKKIINHAPCNEESFLVKHRHLEALKVALKYLQQAKKLLLDINNIEFLAEELKLAQKSLDTITGKLSSDELIGKIFSNFCIGK